MISVYQAFKLILGLIISGFVLYFMVYYAGMYGSTQESTQQAKVLRSFTQLTQDIHYSGNPYFFRGFNKLELLEFDPTPPAGLVTKLGKIYFQIPILFSPGEELFLDRKEMELGWWDFRVVEVMPETRVIFNPLDSSQDALDLIRNVAAFLPNSIGFEPKVTFGFCDGSKLYTTFCFNQSCEAITFSTFIEPFIDTAEGEPFSPCTASLNPSDVLVIIDEYCPTQTEEGICIELPKDGVGKARLAGSTEEYWHKDGLDLAALIIGGTESQLYGIGGENLWEHKNQVFSDEVGLAAVMMADRAELLARKNTACSGNFTAFARALEDVSEALEAPNYFKSEQKCLDLMDALDQARDAHQTLLNRGCDYVV